MKKVVKLFSAVSVLVCSCCFTYVFAAPEVITNERGQKIMTVDRETGIVGLEPIESIRPNCARGDESYYVYKWVNKYLERAFIPTQIYYKGASYTYRDNGVVVIHTESVGTVSEVPLYGLSVLGRKATRPFSELYITGNFTKMESDFLSITKDGRYGAPIPLKAIYMKKTCITELPYRAFYDVSWETLKTLEIPDTLTSVGIGVFGKAYSNSCVIEALRPIMEREELKKQEELARIRAAQGCQCTIL